MKQLRGLTISRVVREIAIALALLGLFGCSQHAQQGLLPKDVVGAWTTNDPRYKDRLMELSRAFVIIVTDRHDPASVQMIDGVETEPTGSDTLYTIYSTDYSQGTHYQMKLQYSSANGGEIRFRNQPAVWKRQVEVEKRQVEVQKKPPKRR
jgi:hypothetical protein